VKKLQDVTVTLNNKHVVSCC